MEIGIIIVLIAGLAASLIWGVGLKKKRDAADRLNTQLKGERDAAKQSIAQLEGERNDAKRRSTELDSKLKAEEQRSTELDNQLDVTNRRIAELDSQLVEANQRNVELDTQLSAEKQRSAELDTQLTVEKQRSADLDSKLSAEKQRSADLDTQLNVEKQRSADLDTQLNVEKQRSAQLESERNDANRRSTELETELQQVAQSNNNAIQLLYLSTLSLQACGIALRRELDRSKGLDEEYRSLANRYNDLLDNYQDFSEDIKSKARQRLVRRGLGVALAFIPGLALIDILGDLGDILDVATEADEEVDGWDPVGSDDIIRSVEPASVAPEVSETGMPVEGISLLPFVPKAQTGIEDTLPQTVSVESTTQGPSNLDTFVTDMLKYMKDLVNSLKSTGKHQEAAAITKMINNLQKLGYTLRYPGPTTQNRRQRKSK